MNRRHFTFSLAALGTLPALPTVAAAPPLPQTFTPYMYGLGAHLARATGLCSVDMLQRKLALSPTAARAMQQQLIKNGVIGAPNTAGLAVAADPYMTSIRFKTATTALQKRVRHALRNKAAPNHQIGNDADAPPVNPDPEPS